MKSGTRTVGATVRAIEYRVNVNTMERSATTSLALNEIGSVNLSLDHPVPFDPYAENRATGAFIIIDESSNNTVGAGMIL